jgi:hypothetical protein
MLKKHLLEQELSKINYLYNCWLAVLKPSGGFEEINKKFVKEIE